MALPSALMGKREALAPRVSGKIRPGIMILTKNGETNKKAGVLYEQGVAAGKSFEEINDQISKECGTSLLRPVNTPFFTVRRSDFAMPEVADVIMQRFAEAREDGVKRLYRFPVVFGSDEITRILDFRFQMFTASGLKFWSAESEDGQQRLCRMFAPLPKDEKTQRVVRMPGGRSVIARQDNGGLCNPEKCPEFQTGQCKMRGQLLFYIPGIPGSGMIEIPTGSKNFGFDSEARLQEILRLGGALPTLIDGKPVFWLTKRLRRDMPMIDYANGKTTRTDQWIIEIEADLDMSRLRAANQPLLLQNQAAQAAAVLTGDPTPAMPQLTVIPSTSGEPVGEQGARATTQPPQKEGPPPGAKQGSTGPEKNLKSLRHEANALMESLGIDPQRYAPHAAGKWGTTWSRVEETLKSAIQELKTVEPILQAIKTHLMALGVAPEVFDAYAKNSFGDDWQFNLQMLPGIEDELMNAFGDRDNYVAAVTSLVGADT